MAATAVADASGSGSELLGGWDFASLAEAVQDQDPVTPTAPAAGAASRKRAAKPPRKRKLPPPWTRKTPLTGCLGLTEAEFDGLMARYGDGKWRESADGNYTRNASECWSPAALLAATGGAEALAGVAQESALIQAGRTALRE